MWHSNNARTRERNAACRCFSCYQTGNPLQPHGLSFYERILPNTRESLLHEIFLVLPGLMTSRRSKIWLEIIFDLTGKLPCAGTKKKPPDNQQNATGEHANLLIFTDCYSCQSSQIPVLATWQTSRIPMSAGNCETDLTNRHLQTELPNKLIKCVHACLVRNKHINIVLRTARPQINAPEALNRVYKLFLTCTLVYHTNCVRWLTSHMWALKKKGKQNDLSQERGLRSIRPPKTFWTSPLRSYFVL